MSDPTGIHFDPVITNPGRLTILTALCSKVSLDFVTLRRVTGMTDGNLTTHLRKLASMGFVRIDKTVRSGKRITSITLTDKGYEAVLHHRDCLNRALTTPSIQAPVSETSAPEPHEQGAWID